MWVTVYDIFNEHVDYGCVTGGNMRGWRSGNYLLGSSYEVRAQVMENDDCTGAQLCDTNMTVGFSESWMPSLDLQSNPDNTCYWKPLYPRHH
jgi:hypothetical protein